MSKSMVLTLGHNASAVVVENGSILGGYEEERFSKIKSDSSFPMQSIKRLCDTYGRDYDDVCIGHWFTSGLLTNNKYIHMDTINMLCNGNVHSIQNGLSHHDSHLLSAEVFADHHQFPKDHLSIVADGFGTFGECITVYKVSDIGSQIISRYFGYDKSLGMLYQYATAYLGMKMHNHEYKMLGYEAHISEAIGAEYIVNLNTLIAAHARRWFKSMIETEIVKDLDPIVNKAALAATQHDIANRLDGVLEALGLVELGLLEKRIVIAYYVQGLVEAVIGAIVDLQKPDNLLVAGGLFYNVKLNHLLADKVKKFCVMPLAGDQGAGLGVYQGVHGDLKWPGHVAWGHRNLSNVQGDGLISVDNEEDALNLAADELLRNKFVNIVRGSMEFGPRSLCNTATLAVPDMDTVELINKINDRTTVMPMAPAMTKGQAESMLIGTDKVVGSLEYMIVTRDVKSEFKDQMQGASHAYKIQGRSTCRPQIVSDDDKFMSSLLETFGPLINTSFNYHGVPIAFDKDTIEYSHSKQRELSNVTTIIIKE